MAFTLSDITGSTDTVRTVVVSSGFRGLPGPAGSTGDPGPSGDSITIKGAWSSGVEYCPNDAVTARSTAAQGVQSLYVQRETAACSVSSTAPHLDPARWAEIGATDLSNITGAIWEIYQIDHGFEWVGTPVAFSFQSESWVKADNRFGDEVAIAVVREVIDDDRALLQTSGEVPAIDPQVILPDGSAWEIGRLYQVSSVRGRVERMPSDPTARYSDAVSHPIIMPTKFHMDVDDNEFSVGVALPWRPEVATRDYRVVGLNKYYFIAAGGETVISGVDTQGATLAYTAGVNTDVFLNGLNLSEVDGYVALDGTSITFPSPLIAGDRVEVWTPDQPLEVLLPSTALKLDNIEGMFTGARTEFPMTYDGGTPIPVPATTNVMLWVDATPQEPLTDFTIIADPASPTTASIIQMSAAPSVGDRFWGVLGMPVVDGVASVAYVDAEIESLRAALDARITALEP